MNNKKILFMLVTLGIIYGFSQFVSSILAFMVSGIGMIILIIVGILFLALYYLFARWAFR